MASRSVRLRSLSRGERVQLERRLGDLSLSARIHQRYRVIAEVRAGRGVAEAAERAGCHVTRAYAWVRRFNASGFAIFELRTQGGVVCAKRNRPARVRATYHRGGGTRTLLAFYDVHTGALGGIFRRRKRVREVAEAFQRLRVCYPRWRLFVVLDNLRHVHDSPRLLALLRRLRITPVFTPTEASWLNLIESHFGALKRATLTNTDDPDHATRQRRVYRYLPSGTATSGSLATHSSDCSLFAELSWNGTR